MYAARRCIKGETCAAEGMSNLVSCRMNRLAAIVCGAALAVGLSVGGARAEAFPEKTAALRRRLHPGGPSDIIARGLGQKLSEGWSQQVVIENARAPGEHRRRARREERARRNYVAPRQQQHPRHQPEPVREARLRSGARLRAVALVAIHRTSWWSIGRARDLR